MKIILDDGWVGWKEEEEEVFVCDVVERRRMSNKEANWMTYTPTPKKKNFFFFLPSFLPFYSESERENVCKRGACTILKKIGANFKFHISFFSSFS